MNNSLSSATVTLKGCMVMNVRRNEQRDEKNGKLSGVRFYAWLQWFGGQANVELSPEIDNIPHNQLLDVEIDADVTELTSKFQDQERWRTCATFRQIKAYKPSALALASSPSPAPKVDAPAFPLNAKGVK